MPNPSVNRACVKARNHHIYVSLREPLDAKTHEHIPATSGDYSLSPWQWLECYGVIALMDRITKEMREVDVVAKATVGTYDIYISVECRDHKRPSMLHG